MDKVDPKELSENKWNKQSSEMNQALAENLLNKDK